MQTLVLKSNFFFIIFCISTVNLFAVEIQELSTSRDWLNLLYYQKTYNGYKSSVQGERYFLAKDGQVNPKAELMATLSAFRNPHFLIENKFRPQCVFPARLLFLSKFWNDLGDSQNCEDYVRWKESLGEGDFYLVFSNAYANNPASMFGHTFLRINRTGFSQKTNEILGYSFAFQARPDPADNPLTYTLKGLFGGYYAYLMTQPFYINIGVYNNAEARDLWEYKLNFSKATKKLLVAHMWEISSSVAFEYYFFDENCSTFLLQLIEAVDPQVEFESKNRFFVIPMESVKEIYSKFSISEIQQRHSLNKKILAQYTKLSNKQKRVLSQVKDDLDLLKKIEDIQILDTLNLYWKYRNYQKKTNLSPQEKKLMFATLTRRSEVVGEAKIPELKLENREAPHISHEKIRISAFGQKGGYQLQFRYGFHDFTDDDQGYFPGAYISLFDIRLMAKDALTKVHSIDWLKILSLQDFNQFSKGMSWQVNMNTLMLKDGNFQRFKAGIGIASLGTKIQFYYMPIVEVFEWQENTTVFINNELGFKYHLSDRSWFVMNLMQDEFDFNSWQSQSLVRYKLDEIYLNLEYNKNTIQEITSLGITKYF